MLPANEMSMGNQGCSGRQWQHSETRNMGKMGLRLLERRGRETRENKHGIFQSCYLKIPLKIPTTKLSSI